MLLTIGNSSVRIDLNNARAPYPHFLTSTICNISLQLLHTPTYVPTIIIIIFLPSMICLARHQQKSHYSSLLIYPTRITHLPYHNYKIIPPIGTLTTGKSMFQLPSPAFCEPFAHSRHEITLSYYFLWIILVFQLM